MTYDSNYQGTPEFSTVANEIKEDEDLIPDVGRQAYRNIIHSTRTLFRTQFEKYEDDTFNESSPETIASSTTADFACDGLADTDIDKLDSQPQIWNPSTDRLTGFVDQAMYFIIVKLNLKPTNLTNETLVNLVDLSGAQDTLILTSIGLETSSTSAFEFAEAIIPFFAPVGSSLKTYKLTMTTNSASVDVAERRLIILRNM